MPRALNQRRRRSSVTMQCWRIQRTSGGRSITPSNTKTTRYACPTGPGKDMWSCSRGRSSMMDMQLVSSRDDLHWDRTADRKLFMHLVPTNSYRGGAFDCTQSYPLRHRWRKTDGAGCSTRLYRAAQRPGRRPRRAHRPGHHSPGWLLLSRCHKSGICPYPSLYLEREPFRVCNRQG